MEDRILLNYIFAALSFLIILSFREYIQSYVIYKLGDDTPKKEGRLTLNPAAHFDSLGFIMMLLAGIGWGKPVAVSANKLKDPKKDLTIVCLVAPFVAFCFCIISSLLFSILEIFSVNFYLVGLFLRTFCETSACLTVFYLLPIPFLPGGKLLYCFLPSNLYFKLLSYESIVYPIIILLIIARAFQSMIAVGAKNLIILSTIISRFILTPFMGL